MKHGKRYNELKSSFDNKKTYELAEAIALAVKTSNTKFDSSIEVHVCLGIDPKKGDQQVRSTVTLPHGTGKTKKVAAFVSTPDQEKEAQKAGAELIGGEELIAEIAKTSKCDFDVAVATPDMMPKLAKIAKILGPRGLMPSPKNETVTPNIGKTIEAMKRGKVAFKNDDTANIHQVIGRASFGEAKLSENFETLMEALKKAKPSSSKGNYIKNVFITSTMGPSIKVAR
ncbi:50S ribosomal protein L1 [Patescibacteria group bacterium]|nr:50S ribosomal protein L1 [Patescibacteria group bacterium]MBU1029094.1 50S ribosomal protein L1 [Patescibacteria group bacterium]MBU1916174.1 50S ribosomal protein L1 [Patescibacteria group bacterium]